MGKRDIFSPTNWKGNRMEQNKPFIKLLQSPHHYYFFDVNRNQVVRVSEKTYRNLQKWVHTGEQPCSDQAVGQLQKQGYLSSFHVKEIEHPMTPILEDLLRTKVHSLVLQLTQECNFRCSYCVYSENHNTMQRSHSSRKMSMETACRAIDYFAGHSTAVSYPNIAFYGGEPLLEFEMMKELVTYARKVFGDREIRFTFTTNGSLLTPKVAEFCRDNEIGFLLSLDGPEKIHNVSRRFAANGKGSYQAVRKNIDYIYKNYPELWERVSANMVINQQYDFDEVTALFQEKEFTSMNQFLLSDMDDVYSIEKTVITKSFRAKEEYHKFKAYIDYLKHGDYTGKNWLERDAVLELKKIDNAMKPQKQLPEKSAHSGPCVPGSTKLFVNVDGVFYPCERVSESSEAVRIGDIDHGIDTAQADRLLNLGKLNGEKCRQCWAFIHCTICARYADDQGRLSADFKNSFCDGVRRAVEKKLMTYIMVKECRRGDVR